MERNKRKTQKKSKTIKQISAGGVVYNPKLNKILLIKDSYGRWALPKGKLEENETPLHAAMREIGEETGIKSLSMASELGQVKYYFQIHKQPIFKIVHNFLFTTEQEKLNHCKIETKDAKWFDLAESEKIIAYKNTKTILQKALYIIKLNEDEK